MRGYFNGEKMKITNKAKFWLLMIAFLAIPASAQQDSVVAECAIVSQQNGVIVLECYGATKEERVNLHIPEAQYPDVWAAPGLRQFYALGRVDGKLVALKTDATACDNDHPASRFQKPNINGGCAPRFSRSIR